MDLKLAMYSTYDSDVYRIFQQVLIIVTVLITIWTAKLAFKGKIFYSFSLKSVIKTLEIANQFVMCAFLQSWFWPVFKAIW